MSERGSFCTEFIYCKYCVSAVREVLMSRPQSKYWQPSQLTSHYAGEDELLPIFAGKIGGTWAGEEIFDFENDIGPELSRAICHDLRVAVLPDIGSAREFLLKPEAKQ